MDLVFVNAPLFLPVFASSLHRKWSVFLVKGVDGNEILKLVPTTRRGAFGRLEGISEPILKAVDDLYDLVERTAEGDIERAINVIDQV